MAKVFWCILKERHGVAYEESFDALASVIEYTARLKDFYRMSLPSRPPAHARNAYCQLFFYKTPNPDPEDTLVMLDVDHVMSENLVEKLASHTQGVVGALAVSRGSMPFTCFFKRDTDGTIYNLTEWDEGELAEGTITGTGAIAIKRWVLERLIHCAPSWFRYNYAGYEMEATEDMYFGYECEKAGIPHYCDTALWIPHCTVAFTTPDDWKDWLKDHPQARKRIEEPVKVKRNGHLNIVEGETWTRNIAQAIRLKS